MYTREISLQRDVRHFFEKQGYNTYLEVPSLGRSIDLVYFKSEEIVAVELKLSDWKRAIEQARDHLLAVEYSYVCLPRRKKTSYLIESFNESPVGLIFAKNNGRYIDLEEIIPAEKSNKKIDFAKKWIIEKTNKREEQNRGVEIEG